jgi:calcineurin-like phosphoesterase family protein
MKYYFLADTHFGHSAIIKYCNRPFMDASEKGIYDLIQKGIVPQKELKISKESTEKMDAAIMQSINNVVGHKDTLILLGDFSLSSEYEIVKKYRDRINCQNIFLILGNHDNREVCEKVFPQCFENYLFKIDNYCCSKINPSNYIKNLNTTFLLNINIYNIWLYLLYIRFFGIFR